MAAATLAEVIPPEWASVPVPPMSVIAGSTSLTYANPLRIEVGGSHLSGPHEKLRFVMAHEWGHVIAIRFGTGEFLGAPPAGFPRTRNPAEMWGVCVAAVLTPEWYQSSHGLGPCPPEAAAFTAAFLAAGPPR